MILEDEMQYLTCVAAIIKKINPISMKANRGSDTSYGHQGYNWKECDYCYFSENTKDNYYKLIGYRNDLKLRKHYINSSSSRTWVRLNIFKVLRC